MSWAAHELESVILHKHLKVAWRISYMAILIGALLPDFTKLPVYGLNIAGHELLKADNVFQYHRGWPGMGPTHSLMFGVLVAVVVYLLTRSAPWAIGLMLGQWTHVLTDTADSVGCMVFFPFTTQHYSLGMWQYSPQMGRYGDTASYYSGLGGVWDFFWLMVLLLVARRALGERYFREHVEPTDEFWPWLRRRFHAPDRMLRAIFRAYVFYGACRIFGWFLWARFVNPNRGEQYLDWSWGGPGWVTPAPQVVGASTWPGLVGVTALGAIGVATSTWLAWVLIRRWDRGRTAAAEQRPELDTGDLAPDLPGSSPAAPLVVRDGSLAIVSSQRPP
jgi:membrane-bound metal-dependent hydrolase YbcI (DUF457 family)